MKWQENEWELEYQIGRDSAYDSSWVVTAEINGNLCEGIGVISCGELVDVTDIEEVSE